MNFAKLRQALDGKKISAVELTQEYLNKIKHNTDLNCYITVCEDTAISQAKHAQEIINSGNSKPLTGIPFSIKDNICTKDIRTTCASRMLENFVPVYDATAAAKIKSESCVILGKTNMDEFAMGNSTATSYFGRVRNPYNKNNIPGGSSGGSAAAVAAGLCAVSLASDTGGSITQPSSLCGVTGLKPTYGTISRYGLIAYASSLDCIGIIANSAHDAGYVLNSIYGCDTHDATTSSNTKGNYTSLIGKNLSKLKLALPVEFFDIAENADTVLNAVEFYKALGCEIIECSLPSLEYAVSAYYIIASAEAATNLARFDGIRYGFRADDDLTYSELIKKSRSIGFGSEVKRRIMLGNYVLSAGYYDEYYKKACMIQAHLKKEYDDIFKVCDAVITPTTPRSEYAVSGFENPTDAYREDIFTVPANLAGLPSVSTPCGYTDNGIPIGMNITGRAYDEKTILALCDVFEQSFKRKECVL